jgi:hypothetical protein
VAAPSKAVPASAPQLLAKQKFEAWGHEYNPGDVVPQAHALAWPEGTLANRLNGGDVEYGLPKE